MVLGRIKRLLVQGLGVDLGSVNTLIYARGSGIILNEPSAIAVNRFTGKVLAVGRDAVELLGREPRDVTVHRPVQSGVVVDYELAEATIKHFLQQACGRYSSSWGLYRVLMGVPSSATHVERRGVVNAMSRAGASHVSLIDEGVAAGIGSGVLSRDTRARLIVDIGGGTTNISIVSGAGVITSHSLSIAGIAMDHAISDFVRQEHRRLVGEQTAEVIKKAVGAALPNGESRTYPAIAKSMSDGSPQELEIRSDEVAYALDKTLKTILNGVRLVIEEAPPEVSADLYRTGITLAGGGSLLREMDTRFRQEFRLPVTRAERPLEAVALGAGKLLDMPAMIERFEIREDIPTWELETALDYTLAGQASEGLS